MRFHHDEAAPVLGWLAQKAVTIHRLEWELHPVGSGYVALPWTLKRREAASPERIDLPVLAGLMQAERTADNAGAMLAHYFHINRPASDRPVSLAAAVEHVEAFGADDEILIALHPDRGVISVSRWPRDFQIGVPEAEGWGP